MFAAALTLDWPANGLHVFAAIATERDHVGTNILYLTWPWADCLHSREKLVSVLRFALALVTHSAS